MSLECRNLTYQYAASDTNVFKKLSFRIEGAGFHALFGTSGIGKTTIAKILAGEIADYSGEMTLRGLNSILYTYNFEKIPGWYSVGDHLDEVTLPGHQPLIREIIQSFGMESCLTSRFSQLSLGQQNRMNLARYLLQDFDLLIMDESLANVDEITKETIILKIKELFPDKCFLYISHNVIDVAKFCKIILTLRSPFKPPQILLMNGLDYNGQKMIGKTELEATMLELVNAS
jgi:ABC-type multidrug transport system ATPase subunit